MANVVKEETAICGVEFVQHSIIADPQPAFGTARQAVMWIGSEARPHFINSALYRLLNSFGEIVKCLAIGVRPDLESSAHPVQG